MKPGELLPHFHVSDVRGPHVRYAEMLWQKRAVVFVTLPGAASPDEERYVAELDAAAPALAKLEAVAVITRTPVPALPPVGLAIADRWGEVAVVTQADTIAGLPDAAAIREWVDYIQRQCPECQGEVR